MASPNPRIETVEIGIRELRKITVYPVAFGPKIRSNAFKAIAEVLRSADLGGGTDIFSVARDIFLGSVEHIGEIADLGCDEDGVLDDVDAEQAIELGEILWRQNFAPYQKKMKPFMDKFTDKKEEEVVFKTEEEMITKE